MSVDETLTQQVDAWLQPVADAERPSGTEASDETLREYREALAGKPESQFAEAVPPDFRRVAALAQQVLAQGRDLRLAVGWLRAVLRLRGVIVLPEGLRLVHGLLAQFPNDLYPLPDPEDGAQYARANVLAELAAMSGLLGDLRQATLATDRIHGEIQVRTIEIALSRLAPRQGETALTQEQVQQFFAGYAAMPQLRTALLQSRDHIRALGVLMDAQFGSDDDVPDLKPLAAMVNLVLGVMPAAPAAEDAAELPQGDAATGEGPGAPGSGATTAAPQTLTGQIQSRADLVRVIDMACAYLDRTEPTNPAQWMLRRARQLLDHDFLQLIQILAPGALDEVAKVMGVDPSTISPPNSG